MTRLPPLPILDFGEDGVPRAEIGADADVYFSAVDGLQESRTVFLLACGLPARWLGRDRFTIAELGFGTGLNFLAAWQLWRQHRPWPGARLNFVSFEAYPMTSADAAKALSAWPELTEISAQLLAKWPVRARGVQYMSWPEDGVSLTLFTDPVAKSLKTACFAADAWFLDGFSPAKNPDMWSDTLWPDLARLSAPGARLGTFTVAGAVRRGLDAAGFEVERVEGFGRKRQRMVGRLRTPVAPSPDAFGLVSDAPPPRRVAVLGAGIAGACLARACLSRGITPRVFDPADRTAAAASGNPLALVHPRLDAADTVQARLHLAAYLMARRTYLDLGETPIRVEQLPDTARRAKAFAQLADDPPLDSDLLYAASHRLTHHDGFVLEPTKLIAQLLEGADLQLGGPVVLDPANLTVNGEPFDQIILASGVACAETGLELIGRKGQVDWIAAQGEAFAKTRSSYVVRHHGRLLWGASFQPDDGDHAASEAARANNRAALQNLAPEAADEIDEAGVRSRVSVRATTPDRLPLAGPLPDRTLTLQRFAGLKHGQPVQAAFAGIEGISVLTGLGSRGFTLAPLMAELVVARLFGDTLPLARPEAEAVSPVRQLYRALKRGEI